MLFTRSVKQEVKHTTASTEIGIVVECFPEVEDRLVARLRTGIDEDAGLGL